MAYFRSRSLGVTLFLWLLLTPILSQAVSSQTHNTRRQLVNHARDTANNPPDPDGTAPQNQAASDNDGSIELVHAGVNSEGESDGEGGTAEGEEDESWAERFKSEKEKNRLIRGLTRAIFSKIQLFPDQAPMEDADERDY